MSMDIWIAALAIWLALLCTIVGVRMGWSNASWARGIAFAPTEAIAAHQLFGLLLSANLALLEHDDFNQLASTLPRRHIRDLLARYWNVRSARDFQRVIDTRLRALGAVSSEEAEAFEAWQIGEPVDTAAYRSLRDVLVFLSAHAGIVKPGEIRDQHLGLVAWDVQQVAYLLRLGFTLGYASRESVWRALDRLQPMARMRYTSWKDYSLSALVGMGVRGVLDLDDIGDWYHIARSHTVLLAARRSLLARAADWTAPPHAPDVDLVSSLLAVGMPTTAFDPLR
ncbi:DUF1266 domain-containing protein [Variovorax sp. LT2P21]|uniref:DUF1266 domain-containing protein n=1 Tax=Variovorax sp. LT2P21 TaxID=3443731 RepID=UPI003F48F82B